MNLDGEWRVSFISKEHPELQYGVAPFPVDDSKPQLYGGGYTTGSIIGIPKTSKHKDEAWQLVKYLATNDVAETTLANGILNVPTTSSAAHSKLLKTPPKFNVFVVDLQQPEHGDDAGHADRVGEPGHLLDVHQLVGGRPLEGPLRRP